MSAPHRAGARVSAVLAGLLGAAGLAACGSAGATPSPAGTAAAPTPSPAPTATLALPARFSIPVAGQPPVAGTPWYLAVGDSVTFGFTVDPARAGTNSSWALQLQGLLTASGRPWKLYDTACTSERTDTYYTRCPARAQVPFLADSSQHDAAMAAVTAHRRDLRAVFVDLGSNDLLQSLRRGVPAATEIAALRVGLTHIVSEFRGAAPGVPVILCNFYNPLSNLSPTTRPQVAAVNAMVAQVATATGARVADFYDAVDTTATGTDPHLCDYVDCAHGDIHPTVAGHARLARAALAALDAR
jgi:lysophospholipase L1-like esterase